MLKLLNVSELLLFVIVFLTYSDCCSDGLVGEVLFWSIRQCTGPKIYTYDVHQAWIKIYSHMLRVMVPLAVAYELVDGSAQENRFKGEVTASIREHVLLDEAEVQPREASHVEEERTVRLINQKPRPN